MSYREGDNFLAMVRARSNEQCAFFDSFGRVYSLAVHSLPSARGQGEPLTSSLSPPQGARFIGVVNSRSSQLVIVANSGRGFVLPMAATATKSKAGKAIFNVLEGSELLPPTPIAAQGQLVLITNAGRMLVLNVEDVPVRSSGQGVNLISLGSKKQATSEQLAFVLGIELGDSVKLICGQRTLTLNPKRLQDYVGRRSHRGKVLPRGFTKVDVLEIAR